jgi:hydroxymethylpyrimidine kinase/phosphomethylpyrimidine kinase
MVSETGHRLLREDAIETLKSRLIPLCRIVTPNAAEASALSGIDVVDLETQREAARRIHGLGAQAVLVKGGHLPGPDATDLFYDGDDFVEISSARIATRNTHGTGCTYAAAIAAYLGHAYPLTEAVRMAKRFVHEAIRRGFSLGAGAGPVNHFWSIEDNVKGGPA